MVQSICRAALIALLLPAASWGLGVGEIDVRSKLNEPLRAQIELIYSDTEEAQGATAQLASAQDFARVGLDRADLPNALRFEVGRDDGGSYVIRVTSPDPVVETFLNFLVEVQWENGRLLREYVVLLDPPVSPPSPVTTTPLPTATGAEPETRSDAARRTPPASRRAAGGQYGPVGRGETLWEIARDARPSAAVSINQTMVAILELNPDAFYDANVNALREGAILRLPSEQQIREIATGRADRTVQSHNELFGQYQRAVTGREVPTVSDSGADAAFGEGGRRPREEPADSRLELVPPGTDERTAAERPGAGRGAEAEAARLREELSRVREDLLSARQENEDLEGRVDELRELVASMERAISLKDADLADLEAELRAARQVQGELAGDPVGSDGSPVAQNAPPLPEGEPPAPAVEETTTSTAVEAEDGADAAPEPAAPEPQPAPARAAEDEGGLFSNVFVLLGAALVILGLAGLGYMLFRRDRDTGTAPSYASDDDILGVRAEPPAAAAAGAVTPEPALEEPAPGASAEQQAADLRAQLEADPDNAQLHLRLLRQHYAEEDEAAFVAAAERMRERVGDTHPAWMEVRSMGAKLAPAAALFAASGGGDSAAGDSTRVMQTPPPARALQPSGDDEFDLEGDATPSAGSTDEGYETAEIPSVPADAGHETAEIPSVGADDEFALELDEASDGEDNLDLDFDLDLDLELEEDSSEPAATVAESGDDDLGLDFELDEKPAEPPPAAAGAAAEGDDMGLEFDLEGLDLDDGEPAGTGVPEDEATPAAAAPGAGAPGSEDDDFSLDFELDESGEEAVGAPSAADAAGGSEDDAALARAFDDLEFDLAELEDEGAAEAETPPAGAAADEDRTEFELEAVKLDDEPVDRADRDTAEMELEASGEEAPADTGADSGELTLEDLELSDTDLFGAEESAGTKLDLARAYVEMGDPEGARGMLEEVLTEGSEEQRAEARQLLDGLEG